MCVFLNCVAMCLVMMLTQIFVFNIIKNMLLIMNVNDLPRDIFGVTMHISKESREKEFARFVEILSNLNELKPQFFIGDLWMYVSLGVLSPQSASYFVAGRASDVQVFKLDFFVKSLGSLINQPAKLFKCIQSWQKQNVSAVENTFLFPLAELDSDKGFESERSEYELVSYEQLSLI